jgi:hypothetical protein
MSPIPLLIAANVAIVLGCGPAIAWVVSVARHRRPLVPVTLAAKIVALLVLLGLGKSVRALEYLRGAPLYAIEAAIALSTVAVLAWIDLRLWTRRRAWTHEPTTAEIEVIRLRFDAAIGHLDRATAALGRGTPRG